MDVGEMLETYFERLSEVSESERYKQCLQCGTCGGSCPYGIASPFTPRRMILALRAKLIDEILESGAQWLCTACYTCSYRCPSQIPLTDAIIPALRELSLLEGNPPEELAAALMNTARYGNPFRESPRKRDSWTKEVEFEVPLMSKKKEADVLFIPECFGAYHRRCREITKAFAEVMYLLGVDFAILGNEERCIGDLTRLCGEFGLFEDLMEKNIKTFEKYSFNRIVTHDAHAFNALKREYPKMGFEKEVLHHTQFLFENLDKLKDMFNELDYTVTYHDSCYVGRRNGIFEEPREVIKAIPGLRFVEMKRIRENALCCGGGGGGVWLDSFIRNFLKERPAEDRVREAASVGADVLVTACILDVPMFEDALKVTGLEGQLVVKDISELVLEAIR
ncbi:MAG: (Fe-S)-binding protein [Archaeoglobales archaeon]|nr:MAG: (Fe-S)-binding protein [Archaeoglobales archaeon]